MAIQDQALFSAIQRKLGEPANGGATFFSHHWSADELLRVSQDRQDALLRETHLQIGLAEPIDEVVDQADYDLPDDWIATAYVIRIPVTGRAYMLDLADSYDADMGDHTWQVASGIPRTCKDGEGETRVLTLMPAPAIPGTLLVYYVPRSARLTGHGEILTIPDEMALPVLQYGILQDLLGKLGRGSDASRAAYCQARWQLGIEVTSILLKGLA